MKRFRISDFRFLIGRTESRHAVFIALCALVLFALSSWVNAQQPTKVPRIGFLSASSPSSVSVRVDAFRQGLRELGYTEGENLIVEWRYAEGKVERLDELAVGLVRLKVNSIVTSGPTPIPAAKKATGTIPIIMTFDSDPVANGFVASLARPRGNITGLSTLAPDISGKQLELLKEVLPQLSRVAVLGYSTRPGNAQALKETGLAANVLGVQLQYLDVLDPKDLEPAFQAANKGRADAMLVLPSNITTSHRTQFANLGIKSRLPAIYPMSESVEDGGERNWTSCQRTRRAASVYPMSESVEDGGLLSYGANVADLYKRAAAYVDKILRGSNPADLPVEQPTKFELVINLKTAKQIGFTIPPHVLARADRVVR